MWIFEEILYTPTRSSNVFKKSIGSIEVCFSMVSSIQISEETKKRLLVIMAEVQKQEKRKITYEEAINYLIDRENKSFQNRELFAKKYRGLLNSFQAKQDLQEARQLER